MKVLVVDDSIVFRTAIKTALSGSDFVTEVDVASNGKVAVDKIKQKNFDGVTLDLEMPILDGIETIKAIREFDTRIPIIIFSAQNMNAANKTLVALEMGADDFVQKIQGSSDLNDTLEQIRSQLIPRFKALLDKRKSRQVLSSPVFVEPVVVTPKATSSYAPVSISSFTPNIICLASSTGGPDALRKFFGDLEKITVPMMLVQHMPPIFTTQLAATLNDLSENRVVEAKDGYILEGGTCYLAPGDFHMRVEEAQDGNYRISLDQGEKVCFVRPAADVLFESVVKNFRGNIAGVVFTGMGQDGAEGCKLIKETQGAVLVQDEDSSVVWGMPGAVVEFGAYDKVQTIPELAKSINKIAGMI